DELAGDIQSCAGGGCNFVVSARTVQRDHSVKDRRAIGAGQPCSIVEDCSVLNIDRGENAMGCTGIDRYRARRSQWIVRLDAKDSAIDDHIAQRRSCGWIIPQLANANFGQRKVTPVEGCRRIHVIPTRSTPSRISIERNVQGVVDVNNIYPVVDDGAVAAHTGSRYVNGRNTNVWYPLPIDVECRSIRDHHRCASTECFGSSQAEGSGIDGHRTVNDIRSAEKDFT